jgi:hypothetical protein
MSIGGANRTNIYRIKETVWGTTPTSPALVDTRYTGEGINQTLENITSSEIRADRQTTDLVQVSRSSSGNLDIELSFEAYDNFIESALQTTFGTAVGIAAETTIAFDNGAGTITDSGSGLGNVVVGQWIKVQNAANSNNNLVYRVTAAAAGSLTVVPVPGTTETAGAAVTITGQMARNGVTPSSFTIQKRFNDTTAVTYHTFTGMYVDTLSLDFSTGAILSGSFGFLGKGSTISEAQIAGATDVPASSNDVLNSVSNIQNVEIDDVDTTLNINSLTVDIANNLREQKAIGSVDAVGVGSGRLEVTGNISIYFESKDEFDKYIAATSFKLSYRVEDSTGQAYVFTFPRIKYESMTVNASGTDTDIFLEGSWRAIRDATSDSMIQIDRLPLTN